MKRALITFISVTLLLFGWQIMSWIVNMPDLIPSAPVMLNTLAELFISPSFYQSAIATILRGLTGMLFSLIAATGLSILFARNEWIYELFRPLLIIMRSIPVISFILLALIFLNPEIIPLIIAFLTMFPLLVENLTKGIRSQRTELMSMARQFRIGKWNKITQILYPQLKPFLYSGLASASGFGWRAIIMGEVLSQCSLGIGSEMKRAQIFIAVPDLMAWTLIAILISFLFDRAISWLGRLTPAVSYSSELSLPVLKFSDIEIENISCQYKRTTLLISLTFSFKSGTIYGISAPSGIGKTTLLNLINGSLKLAGGKITRSSEQGIACVFQEPELLPQLSVLENIALPLASFMDRNSAKLCAELHLRDMELETYANSTPGELSFGQQQRVAIARALAYPSSLLLMDEPFKGLDESLSFRIIERIRKKQHETQQTILFTSHNQEELNFLANRIVYLDTKKT